MPSTAPRTTRQGVWVFLCITFGLTWLPFAPVLVGGPAVPLLMPFAPAVAAVVVRRWITQEGFADLRLRPRLGQVWPWLVIALVWPLLAMPLAVTAAALLGAGEPDLGRVDPVSLALWTAASVAAAPVFLGEELGWRGYLQVRIFPGRRVVAAAVTGAVWAVWHFPLWLIVLDLATWVLPLATVSLIVTSVFLGWLQERSGSVWAPAVGHSTNNTFEASFGAVAFTGGSGNVWLPLGPSMIIAAAEAVVLLGGVLAGSRRRQRHGSGARRVAAAPPSVADLEGDASTAGQVAHGRPTAAARVPSRTVRT